MHWLQSVFSWYFFGLLLALAFLPLTKKIFSKAPDYAYPFARVIGLLAVSYGLLVLGVLRIVPFSREAIFVIIAVVAVISYRKLIGQDMGKVIMRHSRAIAWMLVEEAIFLGALIMWAYVRGQEPSIHGLEKFMDYGFMQSIGRAQFFPPVDMWFSGEIGKAITYPINYYYFGHLSGALLIKFTGVPPAVGYNLVLANILALSMTMTFSIVLNFVSFAQKTLHPRKVLKDSTLFIYSIVGALILNFAGNLHTIYIFTRGYENDKPLPPWSVFPVAGKALNEAIKRQPWDPLAALAEASKYWYPNATRFIPFTIHEFPSYSYVVADLHGHVFDIPFVLLTLGVIMYFSLGWIQDRLFPGRMQPEVELVKKPTGGTPFERLFEFLISWKIFFSLFLGFMAAVHYMTNAFDGPIYVLLAIVILALIHGLNRKLFVNFLVVGVSFFIFSAPFSMNFTPFVSGVGVNCGWPLVSQAAKKGTDVYTLVKFIFEKDKCQISAPYQLFTLWGFFWIHGLILAIILFMKRKLPVLKNEWKFSAADIVAITFFFFGTFLVIIPEFFYIKDIYPTHFRANTMFKLGYQAYMMMSLATAYAVYRISTLPHSWVKVVMRVISVMLIILVLVYFKLATFSYYGSLTKAPQLDGIAWLQTQYPEDLEIVNWFNDVVKEQPTILEAQGDSYTDHERISAYTGLPTVAGWWVHEWLWRGTASIVGDRIPDIEAIYQSPDVAQTRALLRKYNVKYVIVSEIERKRYEVNEKKIIEEKFTQLGDLVYTSTNGKGKVYKIK